MTNYPLELIAKGAMIGYVIIFTVLVVTAILIAKNKINIR